LREVDAETAAIQSKFIELIMKCLWKLAKSVQENLKTGTLLPNQLLRDLNNFFLAIPPAEWKRREKEKVLLGELPLRTVKTLLLELVTGLGGNVYEHLDLIEDPPKSYVYPYLQHMLEATKKKDKQAGNQAISDNNNTSSRPSSIASARSISSVSSDLPTDSARASPVRDSSPQRTPTQTSLRNSYQARNSSINEPSARSSPPARSSPVPDVPGHINETMSNASEPVSPASPRTPMTPKSTQTSSASEIEMNARLSQIFLKIGTREESKKVNKMLYH